MTHSRPITLVVAVAVCALLLALDQSGAFRHAVVAWEQFLKGWLKVELVELPHRVPWQYLSHTALAFISAYVCRVLPQRSHGVLFMVGAGLLVLTLAVVLATRGHLFEPLSSLLAVTGAGGGSLALHSTQRSRTVTAFRKFFVGRLTAEKFADLIVHREPIKLSGTREVSTLSCRITNLPSLILKMEVEQLEKLSSGFQLLVGQTLVQLGAYLDTSDSHGVTVHFGFPMRDANHAREACRAALALRGVCDEIVADAEKRWEQRPQIAISVASGPVACGLIGYGKFQSYSLMGEPVDLSLKLCQKTSIDPQPILISKATAEALKGQAELKKADSDEAQILVSLKLG